MKSQAKKILVVSENAPLCKYLIRKVNEIQLKQEMLLDICYTAYNSQPKQMIEIGAKKINMKDPSTVEEISSTYDMVLSLHCKQIFPKSLIERVTCINFHPGYNPYNRGWYPQVFSLINGLPIGATIHVMDSEVDHGAIIDQAKVDISMQDTSLDLYEKVISVEKELIKKNIRSILEESFETFTPSSEGNYNGIKDFHSICALDLNHSGTLRDHINLLRATSHGTHKNAYFKDEHGNKVYVRISLSASEQE